MQETHHTVNLSETPTQQRREVGTRDDDTSMSTTGACGADECNHPYTVGLVSTPYGCESKEMNIRSDWVFCLWGAWLWGRHEPDRTLKEPHRKTVYDRTDMRDQGYVASTDHGERLCRRVRATTQMAHRSRAWRTQRTPLKVQQGYEHKMSMRQSR